MIRMVTKMPEQMTKQDAIETLEIFRNDYTREDSAICRAINIAIEVLRNKTIEPEVRHGRWIPTEYDSYADGAPVWDKWECSECCHEHEGEEDTLTAFCPDCGAKMDGGAEQ